MKINIRKVGGIYHEVSVEEGNTKIDLGLHDSNECMELAKELKNAIQRLLDDEEYNSLMNEQ